MKKGQAGFSLVETMIAVAMLGFLILAVLASLQWGVVSAVRSREELRGSRLSQMIHARLLTMDFYNVFACNSSQANFGLWGAYPERAALQTLHDAVKGAGFTHFTIGTTFMRRDSSDSNGNGLISDLVPFVDANNDRIDDFDPNIRFFDQNVDGDYYDTYLVSGRKIAEQPDTHIKLLTITIWKGAQTISIKQGELLSAEQFSGIENPSSEASLQITINSPENGAALYRMLTGPQISAHNLVITSTYPADIIAYRADTGAAIQLLGTTEPLGTVSFYIGTPGGAVLDTVDADMLGDFSKTSIGVTNGLVEGFNTVYARTTKSTLSSPYAEKDYLLDINPPSITNNTPTGPSIRSLSPYIGCLLQDLGVATTTVSGIAEEVITFKSDGSTVPFHYDASTGKLVWLSTDTRLPPTLVDEQTYTIKVEGGDKAFYKTDRTWTFTADILNTDNSPPTVSNRTPLGANAASLPVISCRLTDLQSGIIPQSIVMTLDGVVVVSTTVTPVLGGYYDAETNTVSYTPPASLGAGSFHTVAIHAEHWSQDPPDADKRILDKLYDVNAEWTFTVAP